MALDFPNAPTIGQTFTAPDGTVWTWDGVKWVVGSSASGLIAAQQIDYDPLRLTAVGTKLKALGPTTSFNNQAAAVNAALDGALNYCSASGASEWGLPAPALGMCLGIYIQGNFPTTIRPSGSVVISIPGGAAATNSAPMIIPATPKAPASLIYFICTRLAAWDIFSVSSEIAEAMGWVTHPYFKGSKSGATINIPGSVWFKINLDNITADSHSWWDAVNTRYTPKRPGRYRVFWNFSGGDSANILGGMYAGIYLNGGAYGGGVSVNWNGVNYLPGFMPLAIEDVVPCNGTTDYIEPYAYIASNNAIRLGNDACVMTITYLGP